MNSHISHLKLNVKTTKNSLFPFFYWKASILVASILQYFTENEISAQDVHQIPWSTIIELMRLSSSKEEALWYVKQIIKSEVTDEKSLKDKLIDNILLLLQELGTGFALVGREYKLVTPTGKNFFIDLLMYHIKVHAYVVIEVKLEDITHADFGQLNFYVNAIDDLEKTETDNETIGMLLCKSADNYVIETSFKGLKTPIGVSKYKLFEDLPAYLTNKLNSIDKAEDNDSSLELINDSKEGKDIK